MIDLASETVIALKDAPAHLPRRDGKRIAHCTIWRWAQRGLRGRKLETLKVGGMLCTSTEALQRFFESISTGVPVARTARQRQTAIARANAASAAAGF